MFIALALTLLLSLSILRHIMEPACPSCTAKRWSTDGSVLSCRQCGWSSVVTQQPVPAAELATAQIGGGSFAGAQYEICFR